MGGRGPGMEMRSDMASNPKEGFFKTRAKAIRLACLIALLVLPFGLFFAASAGLRLPVYLLLGLMGLTMALAMKSG